MSGQGAPAVSPVTSLPAGGAATADSAPSEKTRGPRRGIRARAAFLWQPMFWGGTITVVVLGGAILLGVLPVIDAEGSTVASSKFAYLLQAPPSEIGDTLAGIAGVLAFVWIIVTVWLQSIELAEQRKELRAQRLEMEEQRKATEAMAEAMKEQARISKAQALIFEDEQRERGEKRAAAHLEALLESWRRTVFDDKIGRWTYTADFEHPGATRSKLMHGSIVLFHLERQTGESEQRTLHRFCEAARPPQRASLRFCQQLVQGQGTDDDGNRFVVKTLARPRQSDLYTRLAELTAAIADVVPELSAAERERLSDCDLDAALDTLQTALAADIWAPEETAA